MGTSLDDAERELEEQTAVRTHWQRNMSGHTKAVPHVLRLLFGGASWTTEEMWEARRNELREFLGL